MFYILFRLSRKIPGVSRILRFIYCCDCPRKTKIGREVRFVHKGLGVVIHPNAVIEDNVTIQHHVTVGIRKLSQVGGGTPIIRKGASIGAYAMILGPIEIGENAVIGAGSMVTHDVPANTTYYNKRDNIEKPNSK